MVSSPPSTELKSAEAENGIHRPTPKAMADGCPRPMNVPWFSAKEQFEVDRVENKGFGFMGCDGILVRLSFQTGLPVDVIFFVCLPFPFDTDLDERQVATFDRWIEHARNCRLPYAILAGTN